MKHGQNFNTTAEANKMARRRLFFPAKKKRKKTNFSVYIFE